MLQIVTKMYFRENVPLHSTVHRCVLYTNRWFLPMGGVIDLPVGQLAPSTGSRPVSTVTLSVTEHLEAENLDGSGFGLVATGGRELVDDLADVLSFALNSVFNRDGDLVRRLVPDSLDAAAHESASKLFRGTFDPHRFVQDQELEMVRRFMIQLLALKRSHFEAAMRAIRRVMRGMQRAVDDPTVAYVDIVAALESLSEGTAAPALTWDRLDARKRRLVDEALDGVDADSVQRVRRAVMEAERLGAKSRFLFFVQKHVSPDYFRAGAANALRPVRGADFERALKAAYEVRSRNVHVLEDLPPEAWVLRDRADTVSPPDMGVMLSLEGLARLARHVIGNYIDSAPAEIDPTFDWRSSLPGVLRMRSASQYWIWQAEGFERSSVGRYFSGFVENLIEALSERSDGVTDMQAVLERIERLVPGMAGGSTVELMVAIYALWHRILAPECHRPQGAKFLADYGPSLESPGIPAFVVGALTGPLPDWTEDQWHTLAADRRTQRSRRQHLELSPSIDAALQVVAAERLMDAGRTDDALALARFAVEEMPGEERLIRWEAGMAAGQIPELDLSALILRTEPGDEAQDDAS